MPFNFKFLHFRILLSSLILTMVLSGTLHAAEPLHTFDGKTVSLEQYTGKDKWTVIMIWASDCHVCNEEVSEYMEFHTAHNKKDAEVLGISIDGDEKKKEAEGFILKHKVNFDNLIGDPFEIATLYQQLTGADFRGTPSFIVFGPDGKIRGAQSGAVPVSVIESFMERESAEITKNPKS